MKSIRLVSVLFLGAVAAAQAADTKLAVDVVKNNDGTVEISSPDTGVKTVVQKTADEQIIVTATDSNGKEMNRVVIPAAEISEDDNMIAANQGEYSPGMATGFAAGFITGLGFTLRQNFENGLGYQVTAGGISSANSTSADVGLILMKALDERPKLRFYALAGGAIFYTKNQQWVPDSNPSPENPNPSGTMKDVSSTTYNVGGGIGAEFRPSSFGEKGFAISIELPLWLQFDEKDGVTKFTGFHGIPIPSVSVVYYFKASKKK